jgi:hypothetical protein
LLNALLGMLSESRNLATAFIVIYFLVSAILGDSLSRQPIANLISKYALSLLICAWVAADARLRKRRLCYDYDTFTFFLWPVLTPIYLFQTRGWRALIPIFAFGLIWLMAVGLSLTLWR